MPQEGNLGGGGGGGSMFLRLLKTNIKVIKKSIVYMIY